VATITLTYSQAIADKGSLRDIRPLSDDLVQFADAPAVISMASQMASIAGDSNVGGMVSGSGLYFTPPGGGASVYYGGVNFSGGRAVGSSLEMDLLDSIKVKLQGEFAMSTTPYGNTSLVQSMTSSVTSASVHLVANPGDEWYDPELGDIQLGMQGTLKTDALGNMSGNITRLSASADLLVRSAVIEGNFNISGYDGAFGGYPYGTMSGTLTAYRNEYVDGSLEAIEGAAISYNVGTSALLENASNFGGDDIFKITMPGRLIDLMRIEAGAGNDIVTLAGGGGNLHVNAGAGNDTITLISDAHRVDGGAGTDTVVLAGLRGDYIKGSSGSMTTYTHRNGAVESLTGIERVEFSDAGTAYDINGNAGQAYRIYKAAFDRAPDAYGLGFWIDTLDRGQTLAQVASGFLSSDEYVGRYGAGITDRAFINNLYHNVLHRDADDGGAAYWGSRLASGSSRGQVLAEFSESGENQAQVIGAIQNGIDYLPF
jgi:hypothetical protein